MAITEQDPLLSPEWYRVAYLRPRLRNGVKVSRHRLRGESWYVTTDPVSGRHHRFNEPAYALMATLNGDLTIDEAWSNLLMTDGENAPTQGEVMRIMAQAFGANLFVGNLEIDSDTTVGSQRKQARSRRLSRLNPLAIRMPLWDPDTFLTTHVGKMRWLLGDAARWLMLMAIGLSAVLMVFNAGEFADYARDHMGQGAVLLMLWLVFPLIKAVHELAHAFTLKSLGGEVHEIGVTLLMLTPVPYVDASASTAMVSKHDRIKVAAAGIVIEAFIASLALPLWLLLEPGLLRELMFVIVFAGVVSTALVNGNPLLRFDGYYVFCDWLEVPNLAFRSRLYWQALIKRRVFGVSQVRFGTLLAGEVGWLLAYAPMSWLYRAFLIVLLSQVLAHWSSWLGMIMLCFGAWMLVGKPLRQALGWLLGSAELFGRRLRAQLVVSLVGLIGVLSLTILPVPDRTYAAAVVWLPDNALIRSEAAGQIEQILLADRQRVSAGEAIVILRNDRLRAELSDLEAQIVALRIERSRQFRTDAMASLSADQKFQTMLAEREVLRQRVNGLTVRAGRDGRLAIDPGQFSPGQFVPQGAIIARILPDGPATVRALVSNDDIALVRHRTRSTVVKSLANGGAEIPARLSQVTPLASRALPSAALAMEAGGPIAIDPNQADGLQAREARFAFDLMLQDDTALPVGSRAMVVFDHGSTSLGNHLGRLIRESFLRHFSA